MTAQENLLNEWQKRLGLQDWHITLKDKYRPEKMALQDKELKRYE